MVKKEVKNKEPSKRWEHYTVAGEKVERKKSCPRCGSHIFLAEHKDRFYCGQCHYTEFKGKRPEKIAEEIEKPAEKKIKIKEKPKEEKMEEEKVEEKPKEEIEKTVEEKKSEEKEKVAELLEKVARAEGREEVEEKTETEKRNPHVSTESGMKKIEDITKGIIGSDNAKAQKEKNKKVEEE